MDFYSSKMETLAFCPTSDGMSEHFCGFRSRNRCITWRFDGTNERNAVFRHGLVLKGSPEKNEISRDILNKFRMRYINVHRDTYSLP